MGKKYNKLKEDLLAVITSLLDNKDLCKMPYVDVFARVIDGCGIGSNGLFLSKEEEITVPEIKTVRYRCSYPGPCMGTIDYGNFEVVENVKDIIVCTNGSFKVALILKDYTTKRLNYSAVDILEAKGMDGKWHRITNESDPFVTRRCPL